MPVKTKKTTTAKKAKNAKKLAVMKHAKKSVGKTSRAKKTVLKHRRGKRKPAKTSLKNAADKRVTKKSTERTAWKIGPENSQSVAEIDIWKKDDLKIEFLKVYRSGWIIVDQLPDLSGYNPDQGVNIFEEFEFDEHQLHDGSEEASIFPNELPAEERERLLALSEEELADEGWTLESVIRFSGPLLVERV
jgi:hypothetical protein